MIILKIGKFRARKKIAAFDYDWTLVKPATGDTFPKNIEDWSWLNDTVVEKIQQFYKSANILVIFYKLFYFRRNSSF